MRTGLCRYIWEIKWELGCVGIYGGLMGTGLCRYIWGINENLAV